MKTLEEIIMNICPHDNIIMGEFGEYLGCPNCTKACQQIRAWALEMVGENNYYPEPEKIEPYGYELHRDGYNQAKQEIRDNINLKVDRP